VRLGAMILTGGASSRMGADKGALIWLGVRAVDRVAALARSLGAQRTFTVGAGDYGLPLIADDPPLGGPVGGVMAGAAALLHAGCGRALVLAADAPTARPEDVSPLLDVSGSGATFEGLHLPMVIDPAGLPSDAAANWPLGRLVGAMGMTLLSCSDAARLRLRGANTASERRDLLLELSQFEVRGPVPGRP
jgi:molybdopterin-guanine dinucleotide biosynthesis protein A